MNFPKKEAELQKLKKLAIIKFFYKALILKCGCMYKLSVPI